MSPCHRVCTEINERETHTHTRAERQRRRSASVRDGRLPLTVHVFAHSVTPRDPETRQVHRSTDLTSFLNVLRPPPPPSILIPSFHPRKLLPEGSPTRSLAERWTLTACRCLSGDDNRRIPPPSSPARDGFLAGPIRRRSRDPAVHRYGFRSRATDSPRVLSPPFVPPSASCSSSLYHIGRSSVSQLNFARTSSFLFQTRPPRLIIDPTTAHRAVAVTTRAARASSSSSSSFSLSLARSSRRPR